MRHLGILGCAAMVALSSAALAQSGNVTEREPDAIAALKKMGAALQVLQSFAVSADITQETVLTTGQKIQFGGSVELKAHRPNGMRVDIKSEGKERTLYFDGKNATLFSPKLGYYASFDAPPTIGEAIKKAADNYGIETPLADLFVWGSDPAADAAVTSAFKVGSETINGQVCDQYAMRQKGSDWQVWIATSGAALPCKLVITTTDDTSMPQYSAVYHWTPQQSFDASEFTFTPPADSRKIQFGMVTPAGAAK